MNLDIGWVDACLLAVLVFSIVVGAWRGLVFEVLSLAGWLVAWLTALWAGPLLAPHLPIGTPDSTLNHGAAFAFVFLVVLVAWSLFARLVRSLVRATPLSPVDRLFGAAFGALRGAVVLLAVALLVAFTPAARSAAWQASVGAPVLASVLRGIRPVLPPEIARFLPGQGA